LGFEFQSERSLQQRLTAFRSPMATAQAKQPEFQLVKSAAFRPAIRPASARSSASESLSSSYDASESVLDEQRGSLTCHKKFPLVPALR
jgi:hypothetical protein